MAWRIYRSTDAGAPVLTGQVGSLIALLDAVLVNGYGSKSAAGWTKPFSGTNKAAYRSGVSAARHYFRVDDAGAFGAGAREGAVRGYMDMTDVDTGTDPFPTVAQHANGLQIGKSQTADATARQWVIGADHRTFIVFVLVGYWQVAYFGEIKTYTPGDAYHAAIIAPPVGTTPDGFSQSVIPVMNWSGPGTALTGHFLARTYTQLGASYPFSKGAPSSILRNPVAFGGGSGWAWLGKTNPADGAVVLSEFLVYNGTPIRGRLRGIFPIACAGWNTDEQFDGSGTMAGRRFEAFGMTPYQTNVGVPYATNNPTALEISDTVD